MLPGGMSGIPSSSKFGLFSITNSRFGTDSVITYGPTPGGGSSVRFLNGVSPGTRPANHIARMFENDASGSVSVIVISPVLSSVSIPEMSPSGSPFSRYSVGAFDRLVEGRAAGLEVEHPLDRVLEVARDDGGAVRVLEPVTQGQLVSQAVLGDLGQVLGEARNQLRARLALCAGVGEQRGVDEPQRLDPVDGVAQRRVEVVGLRRLRDRDLSALGGGATTTTSRVVVVIAAARCEPDTRDRGEGGDREHARAPTESVYLTHLYLPRPHSTA